MINIPVEPPRRAEQKEVKQIRERATKEGSPNLLWEKNVDGREVPVMRESIEKKEPLEEEASKRKEKAIDKHDTNQQELRPQEKLPGGKNQARPSPVQGKS